MGDFIFTWAPATLPSSASCIRCPPLWRDGLKDGGDGLEEQIHLKAKRGHRRVWGGRSSRGEEWGAHVTVRSGGGGVRCSIKVNMRPYTGVCREASECRVVRGRSGGSLLCKDVMIKPKRATSTVCSMGVSGPCRHKKGKKGEEEDFVSISFTRAHSCLNKLSTGDIISLFSHKHRGNQVGFVLQGQKEYLSDLVWSFFSETLWSGMQYFFNFNNYTKLSNTHILLL